MKPPHQHRILYVDDNPILLACLGDYLRFHGFEVLTARDSREAFKVLDAVEPDLIIVDPAMSGRQGTRFLKDLSQHSGHMRFPVLIFTENEELRKFYATTVVDGFLPKTAPETELVQQAKSILAKKGRHLTFHDVEAPEPAPAPAPAPARGGPWLDRLRRLVVRKPRAAAPASPETAAEPRVERVVLTDDDAATSAALRRGLEERGFTVETLASAQELIEQAATLKPEVLLIKEILGGMNGSVAVERLAEQPETRGIPVVLYDDTNSLKARVVRRMEKLGARVVIVRGSDADTLASAIREAASA